MKLPKFSFTETGFRQLQDAWATLIEKPLSNPSIDPVILKKVSLKTGLNNVPHLLGDRLQGWFVVRQRGAASLYDSQDSNPTPQLTLALYASADVVLDLAVF